ncbi:hypothetical protein HOY82DRAFT_229913 [Tuber indicum]|nr:hypothetical protein HOY82DRAFT_229913 [Tuber indicum]
MSIVFVPLLFLLNPSFFIEMAPRRITGVCHGEASCKIVDGCDLHNPLPNKLWNISRAIQTTLLRFERQIESSVKVILGAVTMRWRKRSYSKDWILMVSAMTRLQTYHLLQRTHGAKWCSCRRLLERKMGPKP